MNISIYLDEDQEKMAKEIRQRLIKNGKFSGVPDEIDIINFSSIFVAMMDLYDIAKIDDDLSDIQDIYDELNPIDKESI